MARTRPIDRYALPLLPWAGALLFVLAVLGLVMGLRRCEVGVTTTRRRLTCDPPCKPPEWCDTRSGSCAMPAAKQRPDIDATETHLQLELQ